MRAFVCWTKCTAEWTLLLAVATGDEAGNPEEGSLVVAVGEFGNGLAGGFGVGGVDLPVWKFAQGGC
jgi:hypothetical protein